MPVSAILVVSTRYLSEPTGEQLSLANRVAGNQDLSPIALLKILGQSVLERTISRLQAAGIKKISVVNESGLGPNFVMDVLLRQSTNGYKSIILMKLGSYAELDYAELLKFHYEAHAPVTRVCDSDGPLDVWVLDPVQLVRSGASFDTSSGVDGDLPLLFLTKNYVNRMEDAGSVRALAVDMLLGRCAVTPSGHEIEPGIWIDRGARVHRSVRIVGPAYIGRSARVRASAVIARLSVLEQGSLIDQGAVIEEASILPHTYVGKGINVAHAIVAGNHLVHLRSAVAVTIDDPQIIRRRKSGERSLQYEGKSVEFVAPPLKSNDLETVVCTPGRQRPALRILFKGEA